MGCPRSLAFGDLGKRELQGRYPRAGFGRAWLQPCHKYRKMNLAFRPWMYFGKYRGMESSFRSLLSFCAPMHGTWNEMVTCVGTQTLLSNSFHPSELVGGLQRRQNVVVACQPDIERRQQENANDQIGNQAADNDDGEGTLRI